MYSLNNKQYIFKQSNGKIWNFFYADSFGLCASNLTQKNTWTESLSLQKNIHPSFAIDIDSKDAFHIIFQDKQGNIFYSLLDNKNIRTIPILNSKSPSAYNKHFSLIPLKNTVHFFFTLKHNENIILSHQSITDGNVNKPKVIDHVIESSGPYNAIYDTSGSIYVFYQSSDGKHLQLGYKKYNLKQNFWSEFIPITRFEGDCQFPCAIIDNNNIIHICYQRRSNKQYELVYHKKMPDKNIWTGEIIIHSSAYEFPTASIIYSNQALTIFWLRDDIIYFSLSNNDGNTWSRPAKYHFPSGKQLMCMTYKTNDDYECQKIIAPLIPGTYSHGFNFAFYSEALANTSNLSVDDFKSMILDGLKLVKNNIDTLKQSDLNSREDILALSLANKNLEREFVKFSIKLGLLESELNQIRALLKGSFREAKVEPHTLEKQPDNSKCVYFKLRKYAYRTRFKRKIRL